MVGTASATLATTPTGSALQAGLDGAINGTVNNTKGTLVSKTMLTYVGGPAEEAVITTPSSGVVKERVLFHQRRIFVLLGIAEKADTPRPDYDRMVATFQPL